MAKKGKKGREYVFMECSVCKSRLGFTGKTVQEIVTKIDRSGWRDGPERDLCPSCDMDEEESGLWKEEVETNLSRAECELAEADDEVKRLRKEMARLKEDLEEVVVAREEARVAHRHWKGQAEKLGIDF